MPDIATLLPLIALLAVAGAFAGLLAGMLGVGGGIVHVPAFFYVFERLGYDGSWLMQVCLATSLAAIIITSLRSVAAHHKRGAVDWTILRGWAPGIALGALVGVAVASALRSETLQMLFGGIAVLVGLYLAFGREHWRLGAAMPTGLRRATLSPAVGFLSVLMGIGGGSFGVPLMTLFAVPIHRAVATAAGFGVLIAVPSVAAFLLVDTGGASVPPGTVGAVNLPAFAVSVTMTLVTAPLGARLAHAMAPLVLRRAFAVFILIVALNMLRKVFLE
ncbi:sulfite exporter TauE/SafE family protein [Aestuariicoccus sp. MJ-SS9]|uniref:sulfite exporter TauE/SafE family protein n=1 Tax=Aestuariicoccus sp. MJ-SS9 TaxID=3079855 RepID=UPI00290B76FC|nr:sulfite exporter TauE/SafE family protein [Aestuariicoccus sp. MJ-SS9]MDU8912558.1 sulfite exporter TauE/SafE family protein [Aestuariicoccus sp. MJ-SS9]